MQNIIIKLLDNKRTLQSTDNEVQLNAPNGYIIVAGENNTTNFILEFNETKYADFKFRVDMVNARRQKFTPFKPINNEFLLPAQMTVAGYTFITISAKNNLSDEIIVWERIAIPIQSTNPQFIETAPDIPWGGEQGERGLPFRANEIYESITNMEADINNPILQENFLALISSDKTDPDNGKWFEFKTNPNRWEFIIQMPTLGNNIDLSETIRIYDVASRTAPIIDDDIKFSLNGYKTPNIRYINVLPTSNWTFPTITSTGANSTGIIASSSEKVTLDVYGGQTDNTVNYQQVEVLINFTRASQNLFLRRAQGTKDINTNEVTISLTSNSWYGFDLNNLNGYLPNSKLMASVARTDKVNDFPFGNLKIGGVIVEPISSPFKILWEYTNTPPTLSTNYILPITFELGHEYIIQTQWTNNIIIETKIALKAPALPVTGYYYFVSNGEGSGGAGITFHQFNIGPNLNTILSIRSNTINASSTAGTNTVTTTAHRLLRIIEVIY